ncbi:hypothetical protein F5X96DRAFT_674469 [Biscogniauxia mediterranea]|nr:hypothetical protein F5X96DRAFT_674469 [Biscogniauxia mediterranea]
MRRTGTPRIPSIVVPDAEADADHKARQPRDEGTGSRIRPRPVRYPDGLADRPESLGSESGPKKDTHASLGPGSTGAGSRGRTMVQDIHHNSSRSPSPFDNLTIYGKESGIRDDMRLTRSPSPFSRSKTFHPRRQQSWPIQDPDGLGRSDPGSLLARRAQIAGTQSQARRLRKKSIYIPPTAPSSAQGSALPSPDFANPGISSMILNNLRGAHHHQQYRLSQTLSDRPDTRSYISTVELKSSSNNMKSNPHNGYEHVWEKPNDYLEDGRQTKTSLIPISSGEYLEEGHRGSAITLNCPDDFQAAASADDIKVWWLHVHRKSLTINLLEDLLISCPYIHDEAKGVALAFLSHILPTVEKRSSVGKYIEPGYVMRHDGRHSRSRYKKDTSITFIAAPYLSLMSGATSEHKSKEEHITRTLLQSLYDYDLQDIRTSRNLSWRQMFSSDKTIYAPQLWCLLVDSNVVITLGDISVPHITGRLIGINQYEPGARKTIFIVQPYHDHYCFEVHQGLAFTEFLQLVTKSIQEDHDLETEFDLEDEDGHILTASRWLTLLSSTKFSKATFIVVFRKEGGNVGEASCSTQDNWASEPAESLETDTATTVQVDSSDQTNGEGSFEFIDPSERLDVLNPPLENKQEPDFPGSDAPKIPPRIDASNIGHPSINRVGLSKRWPNLRPFFTWLQHSQGGHFYSDGSLIKLLQKTHSSLRNDDDLYKGGHQCKLRNLQRRHHCLTDMVGEAGSNSSSNGRKGQETTPSSPNISMLADTEDAHYSQSRWTSSLRSRKSPSERPSLGSPKTSSNPTMPENERPAMSTLLSNTSSMLLRLSLDKDWVGDVPGVGSDVQDLSNHVKAMRAMLRNLYEVSIDLLSLFVPLEEYDDHIVIRKQLGCLDQIFKHAEFSLAMNDTDDPDQWSIRDFTPDVSIKTGQTLSKLEGTSFQGCESCRSGRVYDNIEAALSHIHRHLEHKDEENKKIMYQWLDDPCLVWLEPQHSLRHDRWSRTVKGVIEPLLASLKQLRAQAEELCLSVTVSKDGHGTLGDIAQVLPDSLVQVFELVLSMHLITAQRVSMAVGGNRRSRHNFLKTIRVPQNTSSIFLARQFKNHKEKATTLLSKARKDLILYNSTTTLSGGVNLRPIGREFLVASILSNLQHQLIDQGTHLNVLDLYQSKIAKLQYLVNARPQRRLFLEIKAVEMELEALRNVFNAQDDMFQKYLLVLDPMSFHVPDSDRLSQHPLEKDYIEEQLQMLATKDAELQVLQLCARDLKSQVKQSIEILEEGHGKAIRVFTIVTLFFLPMSFFSSFMGMNTTDIRDTDWDQRFFWMISLPLTAVVVGLAMIYGYKWDSVMDFASTVWDVYQTRRDGRQRPAGLDIPGLSVNGSFQGDRGISTRSIRSMKGRGFGLRFPEAARFHFRRGKAYSETGV